MWSCQVLADKIKCIQEWLGTLHYFWSLVKVREICDAAADLAGHVMHQPVVPWLMPLPMRAQSCQEPGQRAKQKMIDSSISDMYGEKIEAEKF